MKKINIKKKSYRITVKDVRERLQERLDWIEKNNLNDPDREDNLYEEATDLIQALDLVDGIEEEPLGSKVAETYAKGLFKIGRKYHKTWGKPIVEWVA